MARQDGDPHRAIEGRTPARHPHSFRWLDLGVVARLAVAATFLGSCACASSQARADPLTLTWRTHVQTPDLLPAEFDRFYDALDRFYDAGVSIPTQSVALNGRTPAQALADASQTYGVAGNKALRYVCRLNPKTCVLRGDEVSWTLKPDSRIDIPAIPFTDYDTFEPYHTSPGERLADIVVDKQKGCVALDEDCRQIVSVLNPGQPKVLDAPNGDIVVPTRNFYAPVVLSGTIVAGDLADTGQVISNFRSAAESNDVVRQAKGRAYLQAIQPIMRSLVGVSGLSAQSVGGDADRDTAIARRRAVFGAGIHSSWTPPTDDSLLHVMVAVIDGRVDDLDCDFVPGTVRRKLTLQPPELEAPFQRTSGGCDAGTVASPGVTQHGTHVSGIIAAKVDAAIGPGVYPFARIDSYEVVVDGASVSFFQSVAALNQHLLFDLPKVVNISATYAKVDPFVADPFAQDLLGPHSPLSHATLFVTAAGNSGADMNHAHGCDVLPACYNRDHLNVMSVVALDDQGDVAKFSNGQASNFGEVFDVAAPGVEIPSSAPGDLIAVMSGTSQAAPIVSGAAAHVFAVRTGAQPEDVRERLIYTSDLLRGLRGKVFGGRLDVDAAVSDIDFDVVTLRDGSVLRGVADTTRVFLRYRAQGTLQPKRVDLADVRRLARREDGAWDLFVVEHDRDGLPLKRHVAVDVDLIRFVDGDEMKHSSFDLGRNEGTAEVDVEHLADYVAAMRQ